MKYIGITTLSKESDYYFRYARVFGLFLFLESHPSIFIRRLSFLDYSALSACIDAWQKLQRKPELHQGAESIKIRKKYRSLLYGKHP